MTKRLPLSTITAAIALASPATGHALSGAAGAKCYTHVVGAGSGGSAQPITVLVNGGTPGATFTVLATAPGRGAGSAGFATGTFDAAGNGAASIRNVSPPGGDIGPLRGRRISLSVRDSGSGAEARLGTVRITNLALAGSAKPSNPRRRRTVRVSGTRFAGKRIHGFVTSGNGRRILDRFRIGRGNVCGYARRKAVVAPSPFRFGSFRFYASPTRTLKRKRAIFRRFTIRRTIL